MQAAYGIFLPVITLFPLMQNGLLHRYIRPERGVEVSETTTGKRQNITSQPRTRSSSYSDRSNIK